MDIKNLKRGDIVNTVFGVAVILDVMRSTEGEAITIYVQFVRSIGRTHPDGDALRITPDNMRGVDKWEPATMKDLLEAIDRRRNSLEQELQNTTKLAGGGDPLTLGEINELIHHARLEEKVGGRRKNDYSDGKTLRQYQRSFT